MTRLSTLRTLAATAAIALVPMTAPAAVTMQGPNNYTGTLEGGVDLGTIDLADGSFVFSGLTGGDSGGLDFTLTDGGAPSAAGTIQILIEALQPNTILPVLSFGGNVAAFEPIVGGWAATFSAPLEAAFDFSFTGANVGDSIQLTVAAIPVPAAGMLLLTALGGLGLMARRRRPTDT